MQFLFPGFLAALITLAIPIIIHLFYFRRFKKVYFTNVRFLKEVREESSARRKLRNLLVNAFQSELFNTVLARRMPPVQLRDTLFVLWFLLVAVKLIAFVIGGVDLQWQHHLWLLPCAAAGHLLGLRFHAYTLRAETKVFFRVLGVGLLAVSLAGLLRLAVA